MVKELTVKQKIVSLIVAAVVMGLGLLLFKFTPMSFFGNDILFDASMHLTIAIFLLYIVWYFIDQNRNWRIPFFILAFAVVVIISVQRIFVDAHNDLGLLTGMLISLLAIIISRWSYFHNKFQF